jgi:hypothetical protein
VEWLKVKAISSSPTTAKNNNNNNNNMLGIKFIEA